MTTGNMGRAGHRRHGGDTTSQRKEQRKQGSVKANGAARRQQAVRGGRRRLRHRCTSRLEPPHDDRVRDGQNSDDAAKGAMPCYSARCGGYSGGAEATTPRHAGRTGRRQWPDGLGAAAKGGMGSATAAARRSRCDGLGAAARSGMGRATASARRPRCRYDEQDEQVRGDAATDILPRQSVRV